MFHYFERYKQKQRRNRRAKIIVISFLSTLITGAIAAFFSQKENRKKATKFGKQAYEQAKGKTLEFKNKAESVSKSTLQKIKDYIKKEEEKEAKQKLDSKSVTKSKPAVKRPTKRKVVVKKKEEE